MSEVVLVDTSAWIALFYESSEEFQKLEPYLTVVQEYPLVVPWPIVYETLRTQFTRRPYWVNSFIQLLSRPDVLLIDDSSYRVEALDTTLEYCTLRHQPISLVDMVCRYIIDDHSIKIDYMLTLNRRDFIDICAVNSVEIIP